MTTYDQYIARGLPPEQAAQLAGVLIPSPVAPPPPRQSGPINKTDLRNMAIDLLADLIHSMRCAPDEFKPTDIIAACKEALDRTEGKPNQAIEVTSTERRVIEVSASNAFDAYKQLLSSGLPVLDAEFSSD